MKLSDIRIDAEAIEEGRWVENIPDMGDLRLKVRGFGNADYKRLQAKLTAALPRVKRQDPAEGERIFAKLLVETVLQDWDGITGDDDQPVAFDKDTAAKFLADPSLAPFREAVMYAAALVGRENAETAEDDAKN